MPLVTRRAIPRMVAIRFIRNRMYLVFVFALGTIPTRCATVGELMSVLTIGAIPGVRTEELRTGSITRTAVAIGAEPIPGRAGCVVSMPRFIGIAPPAMSAELAFVITLTIAAVAIFAPPVMRTTVRLRINSRRRIILETINAEPVMLRTWITLRRRMVRFFASETRPVMFATFGCIEYLFTTFVRTIYPTVRTGLGQRVSRLAAFAIPKMLARLPDVVSRTTRFVRAIPAVRVCRGTDGVHRMMFAAGVAVPVMSAVFLRHKALPTPHQTYAIPFVCGTLNAVLGMFRFAIFTGPIMISLAGVP